MKRQSFPLWLLRDVPAFRGFIASFWALIIFAMTSGSRRMRNDTLGKQTRDHFALMLAHAEAKRALALWRQAYRRLGWPPGLVQLHIIAPTILWAHTQERLANYAHAFRSMNHVVDSYVDDLRARYRIASRDVVAHGSTDARLCRAARAAPGGRVRRRTSAAMRMPRGPPLRQTLAKPRLNSPQRIRA